MPNKIDLTGQIYGRLTILHEVPNINGRTAWLCQCSCGEQIIATTKNIRNGHRKSCGCLNEENKQSFKEKFGTKLDLTGQSFGDLIVINFSHNDERHNYWNCKCKYCGKIRPVEVNHLTSGHTRSCNCQTGSIGERYITSILNENNIPYQAQYYIPNTQYSFDFYVDNKYIIEYDGIHHFKANGGWNTQEKVNITQEHDKIKNQWCFDNNISIIRIPYTIKLEELTIEDLKIETSPYLLQHAEEANDID